MMIIFMTATYDVIVRLHVCQGRVAVGNVGAEGDEAVGVCVERWDDVMRRCV